MQTKYIIVAEPKEGIVRYFSFTGGSPSWVADAKQAFVFPSLYAVKSMRKGLYQKGLVIRVVELTRKTLSGQAG
jgi:hypothetical protein